MWSRPIPKHKAIHPISTVQIGRVSKFFKTLAMWVQLRLQAAGFIWLVVSTPLKNMKVKWDFYSQYMESHKIPCFKPPKPVYVAVCAVLVNISLVTDGRSNSPVFDGPDHRGHSRSLWSPGSSCRVRDDWYPKIPPRAKNIVLRYVHWMSLNPPTYDHFDQGRCYLTLIKSKLKLD